MTPGEFAARQRATLDIGYSRTHRNSRLHPHHDGPDAPNER